MPVFYFETKTISTDLITEKDMISDAFLKKNNKKTSTEKNIYTSFCFNSFFAVDNQQILAKNNQWVFKQKKIKTN